MPRRRWSEGKGTNALSHLASATEAGLIASALTNPLWVVKTRMEIQQRTRASAAAVSPGLEVTPGIITDLNVDPAARQAAQASTSAPPKARGPPPRGHKIPLQVPRLELDSLKASGQGLLPHDRTDSDGSSSSPQAPPAYRNMWDAFVTIGRTEGLQGFYRQGRFRECRCRCKGPSRGCSRCCCRGLGPSLLLVCHGAVQFATYEELKKLVTRDRTYGYDRPKRREVQDREFGRPFPALPCLHEHEHITPR